jgi:hypothetical protein
MRPAVYSNVWYATRDERTGHLVIRYFFRRNKSYMCVYSFSDNLQFIGFNNNLWQLDSYENRYYKTRPRWFFNWHKRIVKLEWYHPYLSAPNEYRLLCKIHDGDEQDQHVICIGWLYNVTHLLIRLQRWIRRMLRVARARRVLCMALHPRLGKNSLLSTLGPDILFQKILAYVAQI